MIMHHTVFTCMYSYVSPQRCPLAVGALRAAGFCGAVPEAGPVPCGQSLLLDAGHARPAQRRSYTQVRSGTT